jgi:Zn-dependent peptidase ImmA (M78 family)
MSGYSDEEYDQLAKVLREILGVDEEIWLDVLNMLRRMKHTSYLRDYVRLPDREMPDAEARFDPQDRTIYLRESVYQAAERDEPHARFTVAHEIAHCAFDHQFMRKRGIAVGTFERKVPSITRDERQADKLAAALLAPSHRSRFNLATTSAQLAERFGLSPGMASIRGEELAGIYRRRHNIRRELPAGVVDFLAARQREGYRVTSLPSEDVVAMRVRQPKYEGEPCPNPNCGEFKMIRIGTSMKCDVCGSRTGDD